MRPVNQRAEDAIVANGEATDRNASERSYGSSRHPTAKQLLARNERAGLALDPSTGCGRGPTFGMALMCEALAEARASATVVIANRSRDGTVGGAPGPCARSTARGAPDSAPDESPSDGGLDFGMIDELLESVVPPAALQARVLGFEPDAPVSLENQAAVPRPSGASTTRQGAAGPECLHPGSLVGQYELIRKLGAGGMGIVFLARDNKLGRRVAIKFFHTKNVELAHRFMAEARATAQCSHENIVVLHEVGEHQGSPFIVFEYLEGETLASLVRRCAPMPPGRAVELATPIVRALSHAHAHGTVHRDLKPHNVLVTDTGVVKVLDFGISKQCNESSHRDKDAPPRLRGSPIVIRDAHPPRKLSDKFGTAAYMSPEQWGVGDPVDHKTDLWATGLILFQMLAGWHPLQRLGPETSRWVTNLDIPMPRLRDAAPHVPGDLADIVDSCLRKRKEERVADAPSLLRALEPFLPGRALPRRAPQLDKGPYAGLRPFEEEDAASFFGREHEIHTIVMRIHDWPLMAVVGPSGIGKSSLVRAGIVPALKNLGEKWEAMVVRPGRDPIAALASLLDHTGTSLTVEQAMSEHSQHRASLAREPGYLGSALRSMARRSGRRLLIFVDQFEELYTIAPSAGARHAFIASLAAAADDATSPVRVIISIRWSSSGA